MSTRCCPWTVGGLTGRFNDRRGVSPNRVDAGRMRRVDGSAIGGDEPHRWRVGDRGRVRRAQRRRPRPASPVPQGEQHLGLASAGVGTAPHHPAAVGRDQPDRVRTVRADLADLPAQVRPEAQRTRPGRPATHPDRRARDPPAAAAGPAAEAAAWATTTPSASTRRTPNRPGTAATGIRSRTEISSVDGHRRVTDTPSTRRSPRHPRGHRAGVDQQQRATDLRRRCRDRTPAASTRCVPATSTRRTVDGGEYSADPDQSRQHADSERRQADPSPAPGAHPGGEALGGRRRHPAARAARSAGTPRAARVPEAPARPPRVARCPLAGPPAVPVGRVRGAAARPPPERASGWAPPRGIGVGLRVIPATLRSAARRGSPRRAWSRHRPPR